MAENKPSPKPKTPRAKKTDRPPHVVFSEKMNGELRLMATRYANLQRLSDSRAIRAPWAVAPGVPTKAEAVDAAVAWLTENTERVCQSLRDSLTTPDTLKAQANSGAFQVVPGAPAKVYQKPSQ